MNIAVLGSGNGGCAVAFDCAQHGHQVNLFDFETFPDNIGEVNDAGGIHAEGELEGFAPIHYAGHDIEKALSEAELIIAVGPAYSTLPFAKACRPHLRKGQMVLICPGSCAGSLEFKIGAGLALDESDIIVAETSTLPYAVRMVGPARIKVFLKLKDGLFVAAIPANDIGRVLDALAGVYPALGPAKNVLQTSLQNGNPVIHPVISLLNAALIERTAGDFYFYEEGVTPAVGRLLKAIDQERIAIGRRLGIEVIPEPEIGQRQGYMKERTYDRGYAEAPGFRGIKAPTSLNYRYIQEDVGYGLVFLQKLGEQIGLETPNIASVIQVASTLMGRDYLAEAPRTMETLGLSKYSVDGLRQVLG
ncbi:MAG: NAD/NADP octopine/nopaline dehydrogenase family protein [Anaerolineae bacterium]|jgi:opine dehydrogenase